MGNKKVHHRGWKIKKTSRSGYVQYEVYNTQGYLTHLLEKGHQNLSQHKKADKNRCIPKAEERLLIPISSRMRKKQRKTWNGELGRFCKMDEKEMKAFLDKTGLPIAYSHFPDNQKPPFLCFSAIKKRKAVTTKTTCTAMITA